MDSEGKPTDPIGPTRTQHENKVKAFHNFLTALRSGTFTGVQCVHIAALQNLLEQEYAQAVKDYEGACIAHPEWGVKVKKSEAPATAAVPVAHA